MERLAEGVELDEVRLYMFCLMRTHVHLLVETPRANLGQFMHRLETGYSVFFNLRHGRVGHLTQGRYGAKLVEGNEYLLKISRYLHQNPVCVRKLRELSLQERTGLLRRYAWSSYRSYVGLDPEWEWVDYGPIRSLVPGAKSSKKMGYRRFVESGLAETDEEFLAALKSSPLSIGGEEFRTRIRDMHLDLLSRQARPEDIAFRKTARPAPPDQVISTACAVLEVDEAELRCRRRNSLVRPMIARMLCKYAGWSQRQVADRMGLASGAAVSQQLRTLEDKAREDKTVEPRLKALDSALREFV